MRLRILSDLHREFGHLPLPDVASDVVILAGDIDRGARGVTWARQRFPDQPVLYIAGNHEHYGERLGRLTEKLREAATGSNVRILENDTIELDGWRFFGATLWTDFNLFGDRLAAMAAAGEKGTGMNDYRKIRRENIGRLTPTHIALHHAQSRLRLTEFLARGDRTRSVVITHHAPSLQSLPDHRHAKPISAAYASDLDELIVAQGPALWVHGHIHAPRRYQIGATQVLNNAYGYIVEDESTHAGFQSDLVVAL